SCIISFISPRPHPDLHSFPTRRSSDLNHTKHRGLLWVFVLIICKMDSRIRRVDGDQQVVIFSFAANGKNQFCLRWLIDFGNFSRSEEHTSELQSRFDLVCRLLLE